MTDSAEAIDLLSRTQAMLAACNLRLHKIVSNDSDVTQAFPREDRASDLRDLDFSQDTIPMQCTLGVLRDVSNDAFTFRVSLGEKPFTRRGVLSVINSLYDLLGFAAPVVVKGKLLLRPMVTHHDNCQPGNWDEPLPQDWKPTWEAWCQTLRALTTLRVPRCHTSIPLNPVSRRELHIFCEASIEAIGAVSYLRTIQHNGNVQVSFVFGKAKLAPNHTTTVPPLELCAAVLGVEMVELLMQELDVKTEAITYYSDSRVVLGYITNESRRFNVYVSNRVEMIRRASTPEQWCYMPTQKNPVDLVTRSVTAHTLNESRWHSGPSFLYQHDDSLNIPAGWEAKQPTEADPEVCSFIQVLATQVPPNTALGTSRSSRFSKWTTLIKAMTSLILLVQKSKKSRTSESPEMPPSVHTLLKAKYLVIQNVQYECYKEEISFLKGSAKLPKTSPLLKLSPVVDNFVLLRVGGRLERSSLSYEESHPLLLPSSHHVTTLLVRHYHERVQHQG